MMILILIEHSFGQGIYHVANLTESFHPQMLCSGLLQLTS